jgi:anti-anti-sigma regulatory factor
VSASVARGAAVNGSAAVEFAANLDDSVGAQVDSIIAASARRRETIVDFGEVEALDIAAAEALLRLLAQFGKAPGALVVRGAEALFAAARNAIEPGRRDPSEAGWMLALQALRVLGRQQAFEDLSIEYCVTYEVSPPSWEPIGGAIRTGEATPQGVEAPPSRSPREADVFLLGGDVLGRMQQELPALRAHAASRNTVTVDCRGLRRMEFVAAGDLLNEVVALRAAGKQVQFVEPNYLVYALMLVMGIQELAEIRRRRI